MTRTARQASQAPVAARARPESARRAPGRPISEDGPPSRVGRPTKFHPHLCLVARNLAAMGLRNEEIAQVLGIGSKTLYRWVKESEGFRQGLREGQEIADAAVVQALHQRR
jgi:hypothetical protein